MQLRDAPGSGYPGVGRPWCRDALTPRTQHNAPGAACCQLSPTTIPAPPQKLDSGTAPCRRVAARSLPRIPAVPPVPLPSDAERRMGCGGRGGRQAELCERRMSPSGLQGLHRARGVPSWRTRGGPGSCSPLRGGLLGHGFPVGPALWARRGVGVQWGGLRALCAARHVTHRGVPLHMGHTGTAPSCWPHWDVWQQLPRGRPRARGEGPPQGNSPGGGPAAGRGGQLDAETAALHPPHRGPGLEAACKERA